MLQSEFEEIRMDIGRKIIKIMKTSWICIAYVIQYVGYCESKSNKIGRFKRWM